MLLLEDAQDLCNFLVYSGRTIPASRWAVEVIDAMNDESVEGLF